MRSARSNTVTQMAGLIQLRGGRKARRSGSDDGDILTGTHSRAARLDPAFLESAFDDR